MAADAEVLELRKSLLRGKIERALLERGVSSANATATAETGSYSVLSDGQLYVIFPDDARAADNPAHIETLADHLAAALGRPAKEKAEAAEARRIQADQELHMRAEIGGYF